ncbi:Fe(3+) ABC transporter substrate-binding protein [Gelidibacter maritimus]|uniref:Fe(3+) ABC transporter substrate-binding protein n=1 Tax=Gelidibacter maritimus TaxID=2761487 RepID=A0A7W2R554_9FLAO|nr:Fe(3+) ABC transporter substrate-binding protein [Gelidibacter maritimus]MBA6154393.1 Fe(3+) ABC transporter substrate-binding protein [Gelidibacter maritimus]
MSNILKFGFAICLMTLVVACGDSKPKKEEVNVYTHRHYKADDELFTKFTEETGIKVNIVNASADELIQRLETEGENSSADILITVDAGRLYRAQSKDLLQPVRSEVLEANIAPEFREKEGHWYGMTYRARIIAYAKDRVNPEDIKTYEDLTDPKWKGKIVIRSSENVYNQSLLASIILADGEEKAKEWAEGVVANMARNPKGSDRDQVKAVASGEADIAVVNTYYIGLLINDENVEERKAGESVGIIFPNQDGRGTHVNVSGIGVTKYAPNKDNAIKLMEFLSGDEAQQVLANLNYEYPINPNAVKADILKTWGDFKADTVELYKLGEYNSKAVMIFDEAGWK